MPPPARSPRSLWPPAGPGPPVRVRGYPLALAVTPDGRTVYAVSWLAGTVTPITVGTNRAGPPVRTGSYPVAITMAPGGRTAYVVNFGSNTVTPVSTSTNTAGRPIPAGQAPSSIAITPDGRTGYVADGDTDVLTPIRLATGTPGTADPGRVLAGRRGTRARRPDRARGEHNLRHADAGQHRDRPARAVHRRGPVRLPADRGGQPATARGRWSSTPTRARSGR